LLNPALIAKMRSKISDERTFPPEYYNPSYMEILTDSGTAHISAADESGLAVSITSTINTLFGSKVMVPETGIIMNNEM
jgi:gamma-glutamyltranspeptidase/glutathione hydrolase